MTYSDQQVELGLTMLGADGRNAGSREKVMTVAAAALERLAIGYVTAPQQMDISGGAHDPVTDLVYDPSDPADCRRMRTLSVLYALFEVRQPGIPLWTYLEREARKEHGWELVQDMELPLLARIGGAQAVIQTHYARSAIDALSPDDPLSFVWHPGYEEYAAHYLHASPEDSREAFNSDVFEALALIYPCPTDAIRLPRGRSYWPSPVHLAVVA